MNKKILLVGTISNVAKTIEKELKVILKALSVFDSVQVFLVESDSIDETVKVLEKIALNNRNFEFVALEKLKIKYPNRIARIAYCRNIYVKFIRDNYATSNWDYVAVADLDGMNFKLRKKGIRSCFNTNIDWDGVMANQRFGYYDIYALRAPGWVEEDCFISINRDKKLSKPPNISKITLMNFLVQFKYFDKFRRNYIYDKMKVLTKTNLFLKVDSAFGGLAIYKPKVFLNSLYSTDRGNQSEHVYFHTTANNANHFFYINPKLINNWFNSYNLNKFYFIRFIREFVKFIKSQ
jgi:hypothetical protein